MDDAIVIVGYAETPVSFASGRSAYDLAGQAMASLLAHTGIDKERIDGFCATAALSEGSNPFHAAYLSEMFGLQLNWLQIASIGGSSFLSGAAAAVQALRCGSCEIAVVLGADAPSTARNTLYRGYQDEFQKPTGLSRPPGAFALVQSAYSHQYGDPSQALGKLLVQQRQNALLNPHTVGKLKRPLSLADYLSARPIDPPLRLLDSVMFCDGANAVMLMRAKTAERLGMVKAVCVAAYAETSNYQLGKGRQDLWRSGFEQVGQKIWHASGIQPKDVQMLQLYDDFSIALLLQLEQLGFCPAGDGLCAAPLVLNKAHA